MSHKTLLKSKLAGLILSGGSSSRMGCDKALLTFPDGQSFLSSVMCGLEALCSVVAVSAPAGRYEIDVPCIPDRREDVGPCAGIEAGLAWAYENGLDWLLSWPVDTPVVPLDLLGSFIEHVAEADASSWYIGYGEGQDGARPQGLPLCALWSISVLPWVQDYLAEGARKRTVFGLHEFLGSSVYSVPNRPDPTFLHNVNTQQDYQELMAAWR